MSDWVRVLVRERKKELAKRKIKAELEKIPIRAVTDSVVRSAVRDAWIGAGEELEQERWGERRVREVR